MWCFLKCNALVFSIGLTIQAFPTFDGDKQVLIILHQILQQLGLWGMFLFLPPKEELQDPLKLRMLFNLVAKHLFICRLMPLGWVVAEILVP